MKKLLKYKRVISLLIAVVLLFSSLHLGLNSFANGSSNSVVLNDCSNTGRNTTTYVPSKTFTQSLDIRTTADGNAFKFAIKDGAISPGSTKNAVISFDAFKAISTLNFENFKALSIFIDIPLSKEGSVIFSFKARGEAGVFKGTVYAVGQDGSYTTGDSAIALNGFKGLVTIVLNEDGPISKGGTLMSLADFQTSNSVTDITMAMRNLRADTGYITMDNITAYYDAQSALDAIEEARRFVPKPIFSYEGNTVLPNQEISLTTEQGALDMYYTLDGTDPTIESNKYDETAPIKITEDCTVKAVAYRNENYSEIVSQQYKIYNESDYTTEVLQDGSSVGIFDYTLKQSVTANTAGISPDGSCVKVELLSANASAMNTLVQPKALSALAADEITSAYFWLKNPIGNGEIELNFGSLVGSALKGFVPGTYYLVDLTTATYTKVEATSDYLTIPDGFEGYVVFDTKTASNIADIESDNYVNLVMQYKLLTMKASDSWYYDNITVSNVEAEFTAYSLAASTVTAPYVSTITNYIKAGEKIELFAEEGAEIYYTTDGTVPSLESTKYDASSPIVINADTTIRAIAVIDGSKSAVADFKYFFINENQPNVTILNDGSVAADFSNNVSANTSVIDGASPNGVAYNMSGTAGTGSGVFKFNLDDIDTNYMLAHDAFAFWVRIPGNKTVTLNPNFYNASTNFKGNIATFDTDNGKVTVYEKASSVVLSGFEGYVLLMLDDEAVIGDQKWDEMLKTTKPDVFVLTIPSSEILNTGIVFDSFGFVLNYDKFVADTSAVRPNAPYTDISQGLVIEGKNLLLHAGENTDIYYTLDGTTPTTASTKYVLRSEGYGGEFSPIDIESSFTIKMIAVREGVSSGIASYTYVLDPKYTGPNAVILNDCSDEGENTIEYPASTFDKAVVNDASEDGKAYKFTLKEGVLEEGKTKDVGFYFQLPTEVPSPMQIKAFSLRVEIPETAGRAPILSFKHAGDANAFKGKGMFGIGDDGTVKQFNSNSATFSGFKGTLLFILDEKETIGVDYTSYILDMENYVKNFGFANDIFTLWVKYYNADNDYIVLDNLTAYYDAQKALEEFNIEGLLADYSINTYENANMIVSNDCSGAKVNAGLLGFTDTLTIKKSTYSKDDRNIEVLFGKGESYIEFLNSCKDENAVIAEGATFWVELPKGSGNVAVDFKINENYQELFQYANKYHHYQIDVDGVISRVEGDIILPDGFRGWVVIPKNSTVCLEDSPEFVNGRIDFGAVVSTSLVFKNKNNALDGKTVYIDDICWYTNFTKLVQSRAYQWAGQVFDK